MPFNDLQKNATCEVRSVNESLLDSLASQLQRNVAEVTRLTELIQILNEEPKMQRALELLGGRF